MKIFDWVHCKFHNKDGWSNGEVKKKAESYTVLDQHVPLADAIASWRHGILTIGTFGVDPLKHFNQLKEMQLRLSNAQDENEDNYEEYEQYSFDEKCNEEENGEQNPLVHYAAKHGFKSTTSSDIIMINGLPHFDVHDQEPEIMYTSADHVSNDNSNNYNLGTDKNSEMKGERITLADLFSADCEKYIGAKRHGHDDHAKVVTIQTEVHDGHMIKKAKEAKISPAAKMPIPRSKLEDSHSLYPIKKINRLMTRLLKRKIHPEVDQGKNEKKGNQMKHSCESRATQRISLL